LGVRAGQQAGEKQRGERPAASHHERAVNVFVKELHTKIRHTSGQTTMVRTQVLLSFFSGIND
jgi:hypothetical protein